MVAAATVTAWAWALRYQAGPVLRVTVAARSPRAGAFTEGGILGPGPGTVRPVGAARPGVGLRGQDRLHFDSDSVIIISNASPGPPGLDDHQ